jgi:hypothetical protein
VFAELCEIVEETELYKQDGKPLPAPTASVDYADKLLGLAQREAR